MRLKSSGVSHLLSLQFTVPKLTQVVAKNLFIYTIHKYACGAITKGSLGFADMMAPSQHFDLEIGTWRLNRPNSHPDPRNLATDKTTNIPTNKMRTVKAVPFTLSPTDDVSRRGTGKF